MSKYVLEVENLKKTFTLPFTRKKVIALDDLSFNIEQGSLVGFLGANGAGKTTTMKIILQLIYADSGQVRVFGRPNSDLAVKNRIGFLTERPYFYEHLTGQEFLLFCAQLFKTPFSEQKVKSLLQEVGLTEAADRPLRRYSKGMLQRIGIAQALINDPTLLILDEPMSGLDPDGRIEVSKIIERCHRRGVTVIFSTHLLRDVEALCDRVIVIDKGKLAIDSTVRDLLDQYTRGFMIESRIGPGIGSDQFEKTIYDSLEALQRGIDELRNLNKTITKVTAIRPTLDEIFVKIKKGQA